MISSTAEADVCSTTTPQHLGLIAFILHLYLLHPTMTWGVHPIRHAQKAWKIITTETCLFSQIRCSPWACCEIVEPLQNLSRKSWNESHGGFHNSDLATWDADVEAGPAAFKRIGTHEGQQHRTHLNCVTSDSARLNRENAAWFERPNSLKLKQPFETQIKRLPSNINPKLHFFNYFPDVNPFFIVALGLLMQISSESSSPNYFYPH